MTEIKCIHAVEGMTIADCPAVVYRKWRISELETKNINLIKSHASVMYAKGEFEECVERHIEKELPRYQRLIGQYVARVDSLEAENGELRKRLGAIEAGQRFESLKHVEGDEE